MVAPFYIAINKISIFSTSWPSFVIFCSFGSDHPDGYEVITHCGFYFHFRGILFTYCARSQLQHVGSSSLTRDRTWAPCIGSTATGPPSPIHLALISSGPALNQYCLCSPVLVNTSWFTIAWFLFFLASGFLAFITVLPHCHLDWNLTLFAFNMCIEIMKFANFTEDWGWLLVTRDHLFKEQCTCTVVFALPHFPSHLISEVSSSTHSKLSQRLPNSFSSIK